MTQAITSTRFRENTRRALEDAQLQKALTRAEVGFIGRRRGSVAKLPEYEALCDESRDIKDHALSHLDLYLERYEARVTESGGHVHWAATPEEARAAVLEICKRLKAKTVTKGKSMIGEEIGINDFLEQNGITPIETDLGEYIIQLRGEAPSHIIAPAVHLTKEQIEVDFRRVHTKLPANRNLEEPPELLAVARAILREKFLEADVGITGANFLVAETGSTVLVTNEGNGDLTQTLPKALIVLASIEKVVPTLEDATTLLRVLGRTATGAEMSAYTTFATGPRRPEDPDGPGEYHVVILDNGRSSMLGGALREMLRCIRCGACINHCPVYASIGGHAYGWVYSGPMGAVLIPNLIGMEEAGHLPNASTLCGRCEEVCPMRIPLPRMLRNLRERQFEGKLTAKPMRWGLSAWAFLASWPKLYALAMRIGVGAMGMLGRKRGRFRSLPLAGGWTAARDLAAPHGRTFQAMWSARGGRRQ